MNGAAWQHLWGAHKNIIILSRELASHRHNKKLFFSPSVFLAINSWKRGRRGGGGGGGGVLCVFYPLRRSPFEKTTFVEKLHQTKKEKKRRKKKKKKNTNNKQQFLTVFFSPPRPHVCLLGLVFLGVCSAERLRLGQLTSSELVCDLLFWVEVSAKAKRNRQY